MSIMPQSLAESPIVHYTPEEREYIGDGIPRDFSGKPLPWVWEFLNEEQRQQLLQEQQEGQE